MDMYGIGNSQPGSLGYILANGCVFTGHGRAQADSNGLPARKDCTADRVSFAYRGNSSRFTACAQDQAGGQHRRKKGK